MMPINTPETATLVVVDMQPVFEASRKPDVVVGVTKQILTAMQNNWPIIFLEFKGSGQTHPGLLKLTKGYRRKARISKTADDGSKEVIQTIRRREFSDENLVVCGVNIDACVWDTVHGLLKKLPARVSVVKEACGTMSKFDWRLMMRHSRLTVI